MQAKNLIKYIISTARDFNFALTKTALIKLLYLVDIEAYRHNGKILSGADWLFYKFGPYDFELSAQIDQLAQDPTVEVKKFEDANGRQGTLFISAKEIDYGQFDTGTKGIVLGAVKEWGGVELVDLLNHVYFYTEPMIKAKKNEHLDFSSISRSKCSKKILSVRLNPEKLQAIRSKSDELVKKFPTKHKLSQLFSAKPFGEGTQKDEDDFEMGGTVSIDPSALDSDD